MTAFFRLTEVASRLLFILLSLTILNPRESGQFGLLNLQIAVFMMVFGFERWGYIWRHIPKATEHRRNILISRNLKFFKFNYVIYTPLFFAIGILWIKLSLLQTLMIFAITVCEQLMAAAYWLATVESRYSWMVRVASVKYGVLFLSMVIVTLGFSQFVDLTLILQIWTITNLAALMALGRLTRGNYSVKGGFGCREIKGIIIQYKQSLTQFLVGFLAFAAGQIDKLVVGATLDIAITGLYFKNLFLAASMYTAVNILIHNRIIQELYSAIAGKNYAKALSITRLSAIYATLAYCAISLFIFFLSTTKLIDVLKYYSIFPEIIIFFMIAFAVRTIADINCSMIISIGDQKMVLIVQAASTAITTTLVYVFSSFNGIRGAAFALIISSFAQLAISQILRHKALKKLNSNFP